MEKTKKSIWQKLTGLQEADLKKTGEKVETIEKEKEVPEEKEKPMELWLPETSEGKLSLDIYQNSNNIIVKSALAGVNPENLEIIIDKDILTIKGERKREEEISEKDYFHQECFWGRFSRTVILPTEVKADQVKANFKNGILTIILPQKEEIGSKKVKIKK